MKKKWSFRNWRKYVMAMEFEKLLEHISVAISRANRAVELSSLENYLANGFLVNGMSIQNVEQGVQHLCENEEEGLNPAVLNMKMGEQNREIPVTALLHNTSMKLEQVDMTIKLRFAEENDKLMVVCSASDSEEAGMSEIKLQFKNSSATEGVARMNENYIKKL